MALRVREWLTWADRPAEDGQSLVEYGVIVALVAVVAMVAVKTLGEGVAGIFGRVLENIRSVV